MSQRLLGSALSSKEAEDRPILFIAVSLDYILSMYDSASHSHARYVLVYVYVYDAAYLLLGQQMGSSNRYCYLPAREIRLWSDLGHILTVGTILLLGAHSEVRSRNHQDRLHLDFASWTSPNL